MSPPNNLTLWRRRQDRHGEPWESVHVDLVGRLTRRRADGIVVNEFDAAKMQAPRSPCRLPPQPRAGGRPGYPVRAKRGTRLCTGLRVSSFIFLFVVFVLLCFFG